MELQALNKFRVPKNFRGRKGWFVQLWWLVEATFFRRSFQSMNGWRCFLLRLFGAKIGKKVVIRSTVQTQYPWKVTIGDYSWIGDYVHLYSLGEIIIGSNVVVSQKSYLCAGSHDYRLIDFPITNSPIVIENECWLAADVFVAPGIVIGKGSVIGARSSVFKSIPAGKVCSGTPAKIIKDRVESNVRVLSRV